MSQSVRPNTGQIQTKTSTTLPLEYFDSPDMELVPPAQRLAAGGGSSAGFSRFYDAQGAFTWAPCTVVQYDEKQDMYQVAWDGSGRRKWVKRLNLFFADESRSAFRLRLHTARARREETEREARFHEYVRQQPFRSPDVIDQRFARGIMRRSGRAASTPALAGAAEGKRHAIARRSTH